jgi:hypothetical protein
MWMFATLTTTVWLRRHNSIGANGAPWEFGWRRRWAMPNNWIYYFCVIILFFCWIFCFAFKCH